MRIEWHHPAPIASNLHHQKSVDVTLLQSVKYRPFVHAVSLPNSALLTHTPPTIACALHGVGDVEVLRVNGSLAPPR